MATSAESAKLVAVVRSEDYPYERRQYPLVVDDNTTMVLQFNDTCDGCQNSDLKKNELDTFVQKFRALSSDEIAVALMVTSKDLLSLLSQAVPCVGCRRSVEHLFNDLVKNHYRTLAPLVVTPNSVLSIDRDYLFDAKSIFALLYIHGSQLNSIMESIPKSKKNKRCNLHSLDTHKAKSPGSWTEAWDVLSKECREEIVLVECDSLMETLDTYLRKHRFCSECKSKVHKAYGILVGDVDKTSEKGYCALLYDGLRCCTGERHIHVSAETDYIEQLILRAEPEIVGSGNRRERHAKTLDIAQEEVLTCIGLHLFERLYKVWQKVRSEEQTWHILFYLGVDALRKNFEVALENKRGISNLELMCQEILEEEQAQKQKREQKKQKRRKKKDKKVTTDEDAQKTTTNNNNINKSDVAEVLPRCQFMTPCDLNKNKDGTMRETLAGKGDDVTYRRCELANAHTSLLSSPMLHSHSPNKSPRQIDMGPCGDKLATACRSDCGYSSGPDGCDTCSDPSSNDGSDVACSEGMCNHDDGLSRESSCNECDNASSPGKQQAAYFSQSKFHWNRVCMSKLHDDNTSHTPPLSLQDMLEESCSLEDEEEDCGISEEEIRHFKANQHRLRDQRLELRKTLRQRFDDMQQQKQILLSSHISTAPCSYASQLL